MTVRLACPVTPSLVATMLVVPALAAVTTPLALTLATLALLLVQVTARPDNTVPLASRKTALAWVVWPIVRPEAPSVTATVATGAGGGGGGGGGGGPAVTVTTACPLTASLTAMMSAVPAACDVTTPVALTVATLTLDVDQLMVLPVRATPLASFVTAVACVV